MKTYRDIAVLIGVTLTVATVLIFGLSYFIDIKPALTPEEKMYAHFTYTPLSSAERSIPSLPVSKSLITNSEETRREFPPEPLAAVVPQSGIEGPRSGQGGEKGLSLILVKEKKRFAVLDGEVVKEGDMTKSGRVKMIKKDGILLQGKEGETWLAIR